MDYLGNQLATSLVALEACDRHVSAGLSEKLPALACRLGNDAELAELVALCGEVAAVLPGLAIDLIARLEYLVSSLDIAGLRRWILTGMRMYQNHPARLAGYFRLEDPEAAAGIYAGADGVSFANVQDTLQYYLAGFGLNDIEINAHRQRGLNALSARPAISHGILVFPEHYLAVDGATQGDIYRAAAAHALAHIFYSPSLQSAGKRKPLHLAVLSLIEDARIERLMVRTWPGLWSLWGRFHVASGDAGELGADSLLARLSRALHDPCYADANHWVNKGRQLFDACGECFDDQARFNEVADILANDLGQMRVPFDLDRYRVEPAYRDDNTYLWCFGDERHDTNPQEMLECESIRTTPQEAPTESAMPIFATQPGREHRWHYPEWDYRAEIERDNWVTVIAASALDTGSRGESATYRGGARRNELNVTRRRLERSVRLRRQLEGDELDIDASIEWHVSYRAGTSPDPRIYQRPGRRRQSMSVLLLLDLSDSTNDRIGGSFNSILDIEKRAAVLAAEWLDGCHDKLALHGFASNGRNEVQYTCIKNFDEPFSEAARKRLMSQQGKLSTRMGAALRHAGSCLVSEQAEKKILIFVTDGEPSDVDVHDSRYLVEDARHAVGTLNRQGISTFCLTLDQRADEYVRTIFGAWNYLIVSEPVMLPMQAMQAIKQAAAR